MSVHISRKIKNARVLRGRLDLLHDVLLDN